MQFLKILGTNFFTKVAQLLCDFLGYFEKTTFLVTTAVSNFSIFWKFLSYFLFQHLVTLITYNANERFQFSPYSRLSPSPMTSAHRGPAPTGPATARGIVPAEVG